jgi:hypothetical protein
MNQLFETSRMFASLSMKDLLEARELFHYQLMSKKNVVATAVGLYRIRKKDPWPKPSDDRNHRKRHHGKRTLFNSEVRRYSWPCIYVFVDSWETEAVLFENDPADVVPKTIYLPDGRCVPICVIEAQKKKFADSAEINSSKILPRNAFVPGMPIVNENAQGLSRVATIGCIVKDGEAYYGLTNKHAIGDEGTVIQGLKGYHNEVIGETSKKGMTRALFKEIYPGLPSGKQYCQIDVGLVKLENITRWRAEIPQIGKTEEILDLYDNNFSLQLIGQTVVGIGAITGMIRGEIHGLFYRYKSLGGYEYLCDFLIGTDTKDRSAVLLRRDLRNNIGLTVQHGDSGTLLMIERFEKGNAKALYYPFALLWGRHQFMEGGERKVQPYALATSLSTALNLLDLDFIRDINLDNNYTWGYIGHYTIASKLGFAIGQLRSPQLKKFIEKNLHLLSMKEEEITSATLTPSPRVIRKKDKTTYDTKTEYFVPLADVPDNVWKSNVNVFMVDGPEDKKVRKAGPGNRGKMDNPNHFADIDFPNSTGKTLLQLTLADPIKNLRPSVWQTFYESIAPDYEKWHHLFERKKTTFQRKKHWGALPFRVWQIVDEMINFARKGKQNEFLCAGGVLIHYLGDACQPLHSSFMSQGDPTRPLKRKLKSGNNAGTEVTEMAGSDVHAGYEDDMVDEHREEIMKALDSEIKRLSKAESIIPIGSGYDAALAVIHLIAATQKTISPKKIVDKWAELKGQDKDTRAKGMWEAFGKKTVTVMARGSLYLASIWEGAWKLGNGVANIKDGKVLKETDLKKLYDNPNFLKSIPLDQYKLYSNGKLIV